MFLKNIRNSPWLSVILLITNFVICRFLLFELHEMKDWPCNLFLLGFIILLISVLLKSRNMPLCISIGYLFSFFVGFVFQKDSFDAGGGTTNNLWLIWTITYICVIMLSMLCEILIRRHNKKNEKDEDVLN